MDVLVARVGARIVVDGRPFRILAGHTTAHADAQVVRDHPDLWVPYPVDFPAGGHGRGGEAAGPGVVPAASSAPSSKAVRAWAREQGVEVPARGPLPEDVVARYQAAAED